MSERDTRLGRRMLLAGTAALAMPGLRPALAEGELRDVPRNRTYIVAATGDGPVLTNVANANYFAAGVDLRNGLMYATEPLFWYNLFKDELIPWLAESYVYDDGFTGLTIKVRAGAAWSDGHPFTARDVAFTYNSAAERRLRFPRPFSTSML